ncbi:protein KRI1 homolog [Sabethes cyaneus]|uniref:protein KRI1 homolog n=1 Tax=Sabethes cyaneus TaxID=53552 RepID=UPI00237D4B96|nr:protein KRI1 homolog [Sabethes cyaneus]
MGKVKLFHESDQEDSEPLDFKTNKSYAKHYNEFRKKEILGQLKNLESDEESSSDDETTDEEVVDADFDKEFFRTLAYLKRRDLTKYEEKPSFFENIKPVEEVALQKRKKKEKPLTLKDYERKVIVEKGGIFEDEEDQYAQNKRAESPSLVQQQEHIKNQIKQALNQIDTDDDDELEEDKGLLKKRDKTKEDAEKEQADYLEWLTDRKTKEPPSDDIKILKPLKDFWSSKSLSKEEAFLKDYILNKRFVDGSGNIPSYEDIVATSEDEEELEKQEEYERQYNFRFEEQDSEFIKRYPRNVEDSVRIERNKRKEQRQALKERKEKEREHKKRELEELKAIKLQEIKDKIEKLKQIAATDGMDINEEQLESDFDPEEHDRRMRRMFNDDYYEIDEGDQKPEFPDLDEELGIENYDREKSESEGLQNHEPFCEDDDFVMDADYDEKLHKKKMGLQEEMLQATASKKKKGKRISKFVEVLKKEKPIFDPEDEKTYGEYIDEYYKLDYEDIIGDTPCRFRYVETVPNTFGLTIEEILMANTRELNRWASVKKTVQIRPKYAELNECEVYKRKAQNEELKKKILPSLYKSQEESNPEEDDEILQTKASKKINVSKQEGDQVDKTIGDQHLEKSDEKKKFKKKRKEKHSPTHPSNEHGEVDAIQYGKKSQKRNTKNAEQQTVEADSSDKSNHHVQEQSKKSKKRKLTNLEPVASGSKKHRKMLPLLDSVPNVSESRLRAFGINPKKFHNKLKYGGKGKERLQDQTLQGDSKAAPKCKFSMKNEKFKDVNKKKH